MSSFIPDAIARFVVEKVDSVAQLEALLILRNGPEEQWSVQAMAKRLYIDEEQTVKLLADICANGLAITIGGTPTRYQYQPNSDDLQQTVDVVDKLLLPEVSLFTWRLIVALIALLVMLYGIIWDAE